MRQLFFNSLGIKLSAPAIKVVYFTTGPSKNLPKPIMVEKSQLEEKKFGRIVPKQKQHDEGHEDRELYTFILLVSYCPALSHTIAQSFAMTTRIIINRIMTGTMNHDRDNEL
jgi:hypothetical protein